MDNIKRIYVDGSLKVYVNNKDGQKYASILIPVWNKDTHSYDTYKISANGFRVMDGLETVYSY